MPVRKLRHPDEGESSVWCDRNDPRLAERIAFVWEFSRLAAPQRFPPGIYKHRSIEDANEQARQWEKAGLRG